MAENIRNQRRNVGARRNANANVQNQPHIHIIRANRRQNEADEIMRTLVARMARRVREMHSNMEYKAKFSSRELCLKDNSKSFSSPLQQLECFRMCVNSCCS